MVMNENVETIYGMVEKAIDKKMADKAKWHNPKHEPEKKATLAFLRIYLEYFFTAGDGFDKKDESELFAHLVGASQEQRDDAAFWLYKKAGRAIWVMCGDEAVEGTIDMMMMINDKLRHRDSEENVD